MLPANRVAAARPAAARIASLVGAVRTFGEPGSTPSVYKVDEAFYGVAKGSLADFAIREGQPPAAAAKELLNIGNISARDPRYLAAMVENGKGGLKSKMDISVGFLQQVKALEARGAVAVPREMRPRFAAAHKLARSGAATPTQIALITDAMAQDLWKGGDKKTALEFATVSVQAAAQVVASRSMSAEMGASRPGQRVR